MENENKKIYKPATCEQCEVFRVGKGYVYCGALKSHKADTNSSEQKYQMWAKCPIDWDKK